MSCDQTALTQLTKQERGLIGYRTHPAKNETHLLHRISFTLEYCSDSQLGYTVCYNVSAVLKVCKHNLLYEVDCFNEII